MNPIKYKVKDIEKAVKYYFKNNGNKTVLAIAKIYNVTELNLSVFISKEFKRKQTLKNMNRSIIFLGRMITVNYHYNFEPGLMDYPDSLEFEFHSIIYRNRNIVYLLSIESLNQIEKMIMELEDLHFEENEEPDPDRYYQMRKDNEI